MKLTSLRRPRALLLVLVWGAFLASFVRFYIHGTSGDPLAEGPRVSALRDLEFRSNYPGYVAPMFVTGLIAFGTTVVLVAAARFKTRTGNTHLATARVVATAAVLLLPVVQYLAISNAGELYSWPGDDTGVWQHYSWFPWATLPARSLLYPFFPILREPFWSISRPIIFSWVARDPAQAIPWATLNFASGPPRPWDVKFTAANSLIWIAIAGAVYAAERWITRRRGSATLDFAGVICVFAAGVFGLGMLNWTRLEGPGPAGTIVGHLTALTGRTIVYSSNYPSPGREDCNALVREKYGVERRYFDKDAPPQRRRYYDAFNRVMESKATDWRTLSSSMAKACEAIRKPH